MNEFSTHLYITKDCKFFLFVHFVLSFISFKFLHNIIQGYKKEITKDLMVLPFFAVLKDFWLLRGIRCMFLFVSAIYCKKTKGLNLI